MPMDFSRLQDLSNSLNTKSDELNGSFKLFESKLASFRLGVTAWVEPPLEKWTYEHGVEETTKLGYSKATGSWCLTLRRDHTYEEDYGYTALSQAPRDLRIKAAEQLPKLLKEIEKVATEAVKEVDEAGKFMRDLCS